jgi:catechol 2,3-dioxygenase-like lactoylglutathione lyase family enzyme
MPDLFAGIPVRDRATAVAWYERLLGTPPAFFPNDNEAVWEVAEHRYLFVDQAPAHAGHTRHLLFVDDFDATITTIASRGLHPTARETYDNGVRKATYTDPDGNHLEFGGAPERPPA